MIPDNETNTVDIRVGARKLKGGAGEKVYLPLNGWSSSYGQCILGHVLLSNDLLTSKVEDVISFYNFATGTLLDELSALIKSSNGSSTWRPLITYKNILRAIENIGTEMSLGLRLIDVVSFV